MSDSEPKKVSIPRLGIEGEIIDGYKQPEIEQSAQEINAEVATPSHVSIPVLGIEGETRPLTNKEKSDYLLRSAGRFGTSGHIKFLPED